MKASGVTRFGIITVYRTEIVNGELVLLTRRPQGELITTKISDHGTLTRAQAQN